MANGRYGPYEDQVAPATPQIAPGSIAGRMFPDYIDLAANAEAEQAFPTTQPKLMGAPNGPFGLNGAGLDSAALSVLQALQNQPQPKNALGSFAQGLAGGLAGGRVRQMQSREAANAAEQKRVEREAEYRRRMVSDSARQMRGHQLGMIRDAAKKTTDTPKVNEAYIHLDTPEKVAAFEKQYPHMRGMVPSDGIVARSSIFPKASGGSGGGQDEGFNPDAIADKIHDGSFPPIGTNLSRGQWGKVASSIAKKYPTMNLSRAQNAWNATTTAIRSMNGRLQLQLHNSASAVQEILPQIASLVDELDSLAPKGDATPINKIIVGGAQHWGVNGKRAQDVAQKLTTLFQGVTGELANVYNAGGVPSDKALAMAEKVLNLALPAHAMKAGLESESGLINVRVNAISNFNPIVPGGEATDYVLPREGGLVKVPESGNTNGARWLGAAKDSTGGRR